MAIDKRILKTKNNIKNAYMRLTVENEYEKITVSRIAVKAAVNRSTFYLHYADVPAIAADIERELADKISNYLDGFDVNDVYGSTYRIFKNLSTALDGDALLKQYLLILSKKSSNILETIFTDKTIKAMLKSYPNISEKELLYPVTFVAAGIVSSYFKWAQADGTEKPLEDLIRELSAIVDTVIKSVAENNKY